jgi:hypothetical protein
MREGEKILVSLSLLGLVSLVARELPPHEKWGKVVLFLVGLPTTRPPR